jgi:geranylgeranyl reductase family protein
MTQRWDVVVVGGGPAGLSAAYEAAGAGARTLVLERATHPRYKTCGGGLIGPTVGAVAERIDIPAVDRTNRLTATLDGRRRLTRHAAEGPFITMIRRADFDDALRAAAERAGAVVRQATAVRALDADGAVTRVRLADGSTVTADTVVGADGTAGVTAGHVGVRCDQVDLGLELELPIPARLQGFWRGRVLLDWGPVPASYGWVFPKGDVLTVGVIAPRGHADATRSYLRSFLRRLGLAGIEPIHDSGHLTRARAEDSPLRRGRVVVAGDAGGLLEPWSREGISFAVRSGALAGRYAAAGDLAGYPTAIDRLLGEPMRAGRQLLAAFRRQPLAFHAVLATPPGWRMFRRWCRGEITFDRALDRPWVRAVLAPVR